MEMEVPIHQKQNLTIKEAAEYSNIGINRLEALLSVLLILCDFL